MKPNGLDVLLQPCEMGARLIHGWSKTPFSFMHCFTFILPMSHAWKDVTVVFFIKILYNSSGQGLIAIIILGNFLNQILLFQLDFSVLLSLVLKKAVAWKWRHQVSFICVKKSSYYYSR